MPSTSDKQKKSRAEWYQRNKDRQAVTCSNYRERLRFEMIEAYGGKCISCLESDPIVLVLDHINNDGYLDRKLGLHGGYKLYSLLRKQGWPKDKHQLFCHNCNFKKEYRKRKDAVRLRQAA